MSSHSISFGHLILNYRITVLLRPCTQPLPLVNPLTRRHGVYHYYRNTVAHAFRPLSEVLPPGKPRRKSKLLVAICTTSTNCIITMQSYIYLFLTITRLLCLLAFYVHRTLGFFLPFPSIVRSTFRVLPVSSFKLYLCKLEQIADTLFAYRFLSLKMQSTVVRSILGTYAGLLRSKLPDVLDTTCRCSCQFSSYK